VYVLDLFSGIGGFALGLERAGMRTIAFCERDKFCRAVLRRHWPNVPCFEDVRALTATRLAELGFVDVVCGGFPCQPYSLVGEQRGSRDDRDLWPEMRQVIALKRPTWVLGENVAGLIALALDNVLSDLESLGYTARPFVIPACAVDAKHRRDRVWIIARLATGATDLSHTVGERLERVREAWPATRATYRPGHGGHTGGWSAEPGICRVANGVPCRVDRLRSLGNAVVPQVVEMIGRAIIRADAEGETPRARHRRDSVHGERA
jgi:DNA (cytosine-5)-methyltransferase 1